MYETQNKKIIQKLAKRDLKSKRTGNLFVMITIVLSSAIIMAMGLFPGSAKRDMQRQLAQTQDVIYSDVTEEQIHKLREDSRFSCLTLDKIGERMEIDDYIIWHVYYDGASRDIKTVDLEEGALPEKKNEVLVPEGYMKKLGKKAVAGARIRVPFLSGKTEEYIVSGIIKDRENSSTYAIVHSRAYAQRGSALKDIHYDVLAKVKDAKTMTQDEFLETVRGAAKDAGISRSQVNENNAFLDTLADTRLKADSIGVLVIGLSILAAGVMVIYSVFYISVTGKVREYGQLRTLGMTRRQIRRLVQREGIILAAQSAPAGLVLGAAVSWFLKPGGFSPVHSLAAAAAVFAVIVLTVLISVMKPAKTAASVSPIEAAGYSAYTGGSKQTKKLSRKITPFSLAGMNSIRNRKKTFVTVLSLGIGGALFIGTVTFAVSIDKEKYGRVGEFQLGEFSIYLSENASATAKHGNAQLQMTEPFSEELHERILQIPGTKAVFPLKAAYISYDYRDQEGQSDMVTPFTKEDAAGMRRCVAEGRLNYEELLSGDKILVRENEQVDEIYGWKFQIGDKVTLHYYDGEEKSRTYEIAGVLEDYAPALTDGWFLLPQQVLEKTMPDVDFTDRWVVSTEPAMRDKVESSLREILEDEPRLSMKTLRETEEQYRQDLNQFLLLLISIVVFIILFSMLNLVNTLMATFLSQKTELAMLQSIGMTERQISRMVMGEGFVLAVGNVAISLCFGSLAGYGVCRLFAFMGANYMDYQFPALYSAFYAAASVLLPCVISFLMLRSFRRQSLVERLREG